MSALNVFFGTKRAFEQTGMSVVTTCAGTTTASTAAEQTAPTIPAAPTVGTRKRERAALLEYVADKLVRFSEHTRTAFVEEFPHVELPFYCDGLEPHFQLSFQAVRVFLEFWIPTVQQCDSVLRYGSGRKVLYFPIFTLLAAISMATGTGSYISCGEPAVQPSVEPLAEEDPLWMERISLTTEQIYDICKNIDDEEKIDRAPLEFMLFKSRDAKRIESVVEVKETLTFPHLLLRTHGSEIWQLFSQMCRAQRLNADNADVWGALTNENSW
jgi:hypothetical protein